MSQRSLRRTSGPLSQAAARSEMSKMMDTLRQRGRVEDVRRLERAADEIPNLTDQFSPVALREAVDRGALFSTTDPSKFESYAIPLNGRLRSEDAQHRYDYTQGRPQYRDVPFLRTRSYFSPEETHILSMPFVSSHEGRHRMRALAGGGNDRSLMTIEPNFDDVSRLLGLEKNYYPLEEIKDRAKQYLSNFGGVINQLPAEELQRSRKYMTEEQIAKSIAELEAGAVPMPSFYANGGEVEGYQRGGRARPSGARKTDAGSVSQAEKNELANNLYRGYGEEVLRRLEDDRSAASQKFLDTFGKDTLFGRWKPSTIDEVLFELDRTHPGILKLRDDAIDRTLTTGKEHAFFTKGDLPSGAPRKMKVESGDDKSMPPSFTNRMKRELFPTQSGFGLDMHTHPRGSALESRGDFDVNTDLTRRSPFFSLVDSAGPQGRSASLTLNDNNLVPSLRREELRRKIYGKMLADDKNVMDMIYLEPDYRKLVMRGDKIGERERYGIVSDILSPTATSRALARNNMGMHMFEDYGGVPMWSGKEWVRTGYPSLVPRTIPGSVPQAIRNIDRFIVDELGYANGGEVESDDAQLQRMMRELQDESALMRDQEIVDEPQDAEIVIDPNTAPESVMEKIYASFGVEGYQRGGKVRPGGQLSRQEAKKVAENLERASTEKDIRNVPLPSDINEVFDAIDYSIPGTKHTWSSAAQDTINKNIEHGFFSAPDPVALSVASDPRNVPVFASGVLSGGPHEIDLIKPRSNAGTMLQHPSAPHVDPYHAPGPHGFGMTMHTHPNSAAIPSGPDFDMSSFVGRDIGGHANIHGIEGTFPDTSSRSLIFTRPDLARSAHRFGIKQQINWDLANDPDFFRRAQLSDPGFETRENQLALANNLSPILTERLLERVGRGKVWSQFDPNTTLWNIDGKPFTTPGATDEILKSFDDVVRKRWGYAEGGEVDAGGLARFRRGALVRVESPLRVYHSSPHKFDEFDISKIGTGTGSQLHGHGLYLAENPEVALDYRRNFERTAKLPEYGEDPIQSAYTYDVNLHVPKEKFIDGDLHPADQTPEIKRVLDHFLSGLIYTDLRRTGLNDYFELARSLSAKNLGIATPEGMKKASGLLLEAGIPGIRYLDDHSLASNKAKKTGTHNIVMFDDAPIEIVKRYADGGEVSDDMLTYGMRPQAMSDGWRASSPAMEYSWPTPQQQADNAIASGLSSFTPGGGSSAGDASGGSPVETNSVSVPGMSAGRALGVVGQLGSMFTGIPGLGLAGTALGTALEAREYNAALDAARAANTGYAFPGLTASQVLSGIGNNLSFGLLGTSLNDSFVDNAIAGTPQSRGGASGPGTGDPEADAAAAAAAAATGLGNAAEAAVDAGQIS